MTAPVAAGIPRRRDVEDSAHKRYLEDRGWPRARRAIGTFIRRRPLGTAGAAVILVMVVAAVFADQLAPYGPQEGTFTGLPTEPSLQHFFGTDPFGRDVFSRLIYGSRTALLVGFTSSLVGSTLGLILGVMSAYFGGKVDEIIQRLMDVLISFPLIVLAIAIVAALGPGTEKVIVAITIPVIPRVARVTRASGLAIVQMPYIEAARSVGVQAPRIMRLHIAPNVFAPYLIMMTAFLGQAILLEATLSYLGLGVVEPDPAWGNMLRGQGMQFLDQAPWLAIAPGVAISLAVFGFNLFGDSLRDALDPRLRTA
ncbi:MAG: ABC transporter permease [Chloroflexi bacterium]|nr:ABC transporter permease [Chloroflexota bacterium]